MSYQCRVGHNTYNNWCVFCRAGGGGNAPIRSGLQRDHAYREDCNCPHCSADRRLLNRFPDEGHGAQRSGEDIDAILEQFEISTKLKLLNVLRQIKVDRANAEHVLTQIVTRNAKKRSTDTTTSAYDGQPTRSGLLNAARKLLTRKTKSNEQPHEEVKQKTDECSLDFHKTCPTPGVCKCYCHKW
jgi:hypothetical protein